MHVIFLFAHPRSLSTPFERIIIERNDLTVFHEPFSQMYYHHYQKAPAVGSGVKTIKNYQQIKQEICGVDAKRLAASGRSPPQTTRLRQGCSKTNGFLNKTPTLIDSDSKTDICASTGRTVFVKDMAYHVLPQIIEDTELLTDPSCVFTFLIRDPRKAIASHYKINPQVTFEELGYEALYQLYKHLHSLGRSVYIIDANDLERNPQETVRSYCEEIGIPPNDASLQWFPDSVPKDWDTWGEWHTDAAQSSTIHISDKEYHGNAEQLFPKVNSSDREKITDYYIRCLDYYQRLSAVRCAAKVSLP